VSVSVSQVEVRGSAADAEVGLLGLFVGQVSSETSAVGECWLDEWEPDLVGESVTFSDVSGGFSAWQGDLTVATLDVSARESTLSASFSRLMSSTSQVRAPLSESKPLLSIHGGDTAASIGVTFAMGLPNRPGVEADVEVALLQVELVPDGVQALMLATDLPSYVLSHVLSVFVGIFLECLVYYINIHIDCQYGYHL
jgi:hypothetical protein